MPETFGLIGWPLGHSLSPRIFAELGERYVLRPGRTLTPRLWRGLSGFNVTIPYKREILAHLESLSPAARSIGAVNCVFRGRGYNFDAAGFMDALRELDFKPKRAVVYGKGGAARAVAYALEKAGVPVTLVGRGETPPRADLHVNATPLGMKGFPPGPVVPSLPGVKLAVDLVYGGTTAFMRLAPRAVDGTAMLVYQALRAWELWRGVRLSAARRRALKNDIIAKLWPSGT